jgi:hypothetical protein
MVSIRASGPGLLAIDQARRQRGWNKQSEMWCRMAHTSRATLKRFWRGDSIDQGNFIAICHAVGVENWSTIAQANPPEQSQHLELSTMPDIPVFWGRTRELAQLGEWSHQCRLIALWGLGGVGKTSLIATWVEAQIQAATTQQPFAAVFWHSLRYHPSLETLAAAVTTPFQSPELLSVLQTHRCLLVLDNWEALLGGAGAGQVKPEFAQFSQLFEKLATVKHQSCIVIISREKPAELAQFAETNPCVRAHKLEGMGEDAMELLQHRGLQAEQTAWQTLIQLYRGHPLALNMIASLIQEVCQGSTTAFLKMNTIVIHDLNHLLAERIQCLSPAELEVLKALAAEGQPMTLNGLQLRLGSIRQSQLLEILLSLERRCLLEIHSEATTPFTLAPIIQKYIHQQLLSTP